MAKDGTNRGGARIGAGQKKKPLADKILEGNPGRRKLMVMEFTDAAELEGESMPPPRDYLAAKQKNGKTTLAVEIYEKTWQWLKERRCVHLIPAQLIEQYARVWRGGSSARNVSLNLAFLLSIRQLAMPSRHLMWL
ncbi:hypothetical protein [Thermoanaerobacter thermocopriae]